MTLLFTSNFDAGALGDALTSGTSGFTSITGAPTFVAGLHGPLAMQAATGAAAGAYGQYVFGAARSTVAIRAYLLMATNVQFYALELQTSSAIRATLRINANGSVRLRSGTATLGAGDVGAGAINASTPTRVEWLITPSIQQCRLFTGANLYGSTPNHDTGPISWTPAGTFDRFSAGVVSNTAGVTIVIDDLAIDDTTWVGPDATTGNGALLLPAAAAAAAGLVAVQAAGATGIGPAALAAAGSVTVPAEGSPIIPRIVVAGAGAIGVPGAVDAVLPAGHTDADGTLTIHGHAALTVPTAGYGAGEYGEGPFGGQPIVTGTGTMIVNGELASHLPAAVTTASGSVQDPPGSGAADIRLPAGVAAGSGTIQIPGTSAGVLPGPTVAGDSTVRIPGAATIALPAPTAAAASAVWPPVELRDITIRAVPRSHPRIAATVRRPRLTATERTPVIIRPQCREWFAPILTAHTVTGEVITVPATGWEATFDAGATWRSSRDTGAGAPGWLIADPGYPGPGDSDHGIPTDHILTGTIAVRIRLRDSPETTVVGPFYLTRKPY